MARVCRYVLGLSALLLLLDARNANDEKGLLKLGGLTSSSGASATIPVAVSHVPAPVDAGLHWAAAETDGWMNAHAGRSASGSAMRRRAFSDARLFIMGTPL